MSDWFKFHNDGLDEPRFQFAISEQPLVTSVWLVILSEASKKRSATITWRDADYELFGFARKINVSPPIFNQCLELLERIGYIQRANGFLQVPGWEKVQSNYAKALSEGYYNGTNKTLVSTSQVSITRGEERRGEEKREDKKRKEEGAALAGVVFPDSLKSEEFRVAWSAWVADRKDRRKPLTHRAVSAQLKKLAVLGNERAVAAIENSIANGYQGIFEPSHKRNSELGQKPQSKPANPDEMVYDRWRWTRERGPVIEDFKGMDNAEGWLQSFVTSWESWKDNSR